jgi:DNA-binding NtrC family response regulator
MERARTPRSTTDADAVAGRQPTRPHSVLVVEDEPSVRDALRLTLEPHFRVLTADQGEEAVRILTREPISVMTLDLRMPGWGGPETLLRIRETNSHLQVVIVTAYANYSEAMRALRLRAFDVVSKPFDANEIVEKVRRAAVLCERGLARSSSFEVLDGLTTRLMESIPALSASEIQSLSNTQNAALGDFQARAQDLLERLSSH